MKKMKPESLMMTHGYVPEWSENGVEVLSKEVELFSWEKLDSVEKIKSVFGL